MKRILVLLVALVAVMAFASFAMAAKSVVAIVKATPEEAKAMDGGFHINDDVAHEQTTEYHDATGDYVRALWAPESEEVWYQHMKKAIDLVGGIPLKKGETVLIKPNHVLSYYPMNWMGFGDDNSIQGAFSDPRACLAAARICRRDGSRTDHHRRVPRPGRCLGDLHELRLYLARYREEVCRHGSQV